MFSNAMLWHAYVFCIGFFSVAHSHHKNKSNKRETECMSSQIFPVIKIEIKTNIGEASSILQILFLLRIDVSFNGMVVGNAMK